MLSLGDDRLVTAGTRRLLRTESRLAAALVRRAEGHGAGPDAEVPVHGEGRRDGRGPAGDAGDDPPRRSHDVRERMFFDDATGHAPAPRPARRERQARRAGSRSSRCPTPKPVERAAPTSVPKVERPVRRRRAAPGAGDARRPERAEEGRRRLRAARASTRSPTDRCSCTTATGCSGVSVFETAGELAWDALPAGGSTVELGGERVRASTAPRRESPRCGAARRRHVHVRDGCAARRGRGDRRRRLGHDDSSTLEDIGRFVTAPFSWG